MNVRSFYSTRGSAYTRHLHFIISRDEPDDGNVSQAGDNSEESESGTMETSASDAESGPAASESESSTSPSDSDDDDVSDNGRSTYIQRYFYPKTVYQR